MVGQLLDIFVFNRLRRVAKWWVAPSASTIIGNGWDTLVFFAVAFYASSDAFMAAHWPGIALVDYGVKLLICGLFFLPMYGLLLNYLLKKLTTLQTAQTMAPLPGAGSE